MVVTMYAVQLSGGCGCVSGTGGGGGVSGAGGGGCQW